VLLEVLLNAQFCCVCSKTALFLTKMTFFPRWMETISVIFLKILQCWLREQFWCLLRPKRAIICLNWHYFSRSAWKPKMVILLILSSRGGRAV
jgi:hypothetical protein